MNDKKIAFIICTNNEMYCEECCWYIHQLKIPEGYEIDVMTISGADSITSAYNAAMHQSDAKYKVYLHQDFFITCDHFITLLLDAFQDDKIGMVGLLGSDRIVEHAYYVACWNAGGVIACDSQRVLVKNYARNNGEGIVRVKYLDGMLLATQYDLEWDEKHFDGWDFYDISQCSHFSRQGYNIAVFNSKEELGIHDAGYCSFDGYNQYRKVFCDLRNDHTYMDVISDCYVPDEIEEINKELIDAINAREMDRALLLKGCYADHLIQNTVYSYLSIFLDIYEMEVSRYGRATVLGYGSFEDFVDVYDMIKFLVRRIEFGFGNETYGILSEYIKQGIVSVAMLGQVIIHNCRSPQKVMSVIARICGES